MATRAPAKAVRGARRTRPAAKAAPAKAAPAKRAPVRKAAPKATDVTVYATKAPTDYHKAFAKWIVDEVGYDPNSAPSLRAAFLRGVSIATAARPAFMSSDALEEWREKTGTAKRGPKPKEEAPARRSRKAAPVVEDDEFDDEEIEDDDDEFEDDEESDEFDDEDDDEEFEDEDDEDDEDEDDDEEFEDEEEEEAPAPARRGRPAHKATAAPAKRAPARKAAPAKRAPAKRTRAAAKDDDFLF